MTKEFNLSKEIYSIDPWEYDSTKAKMDMEYEVINKKDVKEFIKKLENFFLLNDPRKLGRNKVIWEIRKLAGDKLISQNKEDKTK